MVHEALNFCNSCGTKLKEEGAPEKPINPLSYLITALCIIGGGGLVLFIALISILLERTVDHKAIAAISVFYLFFLTLTNLMILRQISRLVGTHLGDKPREDKKQPAGLFSLTTAQLEAPRQPLQPLTSVTDHTTRTLDEVMIKER